MPKSIIWALALGTEAIATLALFLFIHDCKRSFAEQARALQVGPWIVELIIVMNLMAIVGGGLGGFLIRKYGSTFMLWSTSVMALGAGTISGLSGSDSLDENRSKAICACLMSLIGAGLFIYVWYLERASRAAKPLT